MEAQAQHGALGVERAVRRVKEVVLLLVRSGLVGGQHGGQLIIGRSIWETDLDLDLRVWGGGTTSQGQKSVAAAK